jgi:hypothetical protein
MKHLNILIWAFIPILMMTIWSFINSETSGVRGTISPVEALGSVILISGKDTVKNIPVNGQFTIEARPGIYQLLVDAQSGYKDMLLERVVVEEGRMTDIGSLILEKLIP